MNAADAIAYWENRYERAESKYEASWEGDTYIRLLELESICDRLQATTPRSIIEIGCGALTLDEWPPLKEMLPELDYTGIDASETALNAARRDAPRHFRFFQADLSLPTTRLPPAELVLSRRCVQNLPPARRPGLFEELAEFKSGFLIECTVSGMQRTNKLRASNGWGPLMEPSFNKYLTDEEIVNLRLMVGESRHFEVSYPFSEYYRLTRGEHNIRNCPYAFKQNDKGSGSYGPLALISWGAP